MMSTVVPITMGRDKKVMFDNGDYYEGGWKKKAPHGYGVMKYANGNKYEGYWESGLFSGEGKLTKNDGSTYSGDWISGKRSGEGIQRYSDGSKYVGNWADDNRSGKGVYVTSNGAEYEGIWMDGHIQEGTLKDTKLGLTYKGTFENNHFKAGRMELDGNSRKGEGFLEGDWAQRYFVQGRVDITKEGVNLNGTVSNGELNCAITGSREAFEGKVYAKESTGDYRIDDYQYAGKLVDWFPSYGTVKFKDRTICFSFDDSQIQYSFDGKLEIDDYDGQGNALRLFRFLEKKTDSATIKQNEYYERYLQNKLFQYTNPQPYSDYVGLSRVYSLVFFKGGLGVSMWENQVKPEQDVPKVEKKSKRSGFAICPGCRGTGTNLVNDFDVSGHPRSYYQRCPLCNGSGYVDSSNEDMAFLLDLRSTIMEYVWWDSISYVNEDGTTTKLSEAKEAKVFSYVCDGKTVKFDDQTLAIDPRTGFLSKAGELYSFEEGSSSDFASLYKAAKEKEHSTQAVSMEKTPLEGFLTDNYLLKQVFLKDDPNVQIDPSLSLSSTEPSFQGGSLQEFSSWVNSRLVYPEISKENGSQGIVTVQFTIAENGRVTDVKILKGVDEHIDKEVIRVVSSSPRWTPETILGIPHSATFSMQLYFMLR